MRAAEQPWSGLEMNRNSGVSLGKIKRENGFIGYFAKDRS